MVMMMKLMPLVLLPTMNVSFHIQSNKFHNIHASVFPATVPSHYVTMKAKSNDDSGKEEDVLNRVDFVRQVLGVTNTGLNDIIKVGDVIIAKNGVEELGIVQNEGYEIVAMYDQGFNAETNQIEKLPIEYIDTTSTSSTEGEGGTSEFVSPKSGYTRYIQLAISNDGDSNTRTTAIVTPEEIGLVTLKKEMFNALWLAIPGLFWVYVAISFANNYNERYGGNFFDALFRT